MLTYIVEHSLKMLPMVMSQLSSLLFYLTDLVCTKEFLPFTDQILDKINSPLQDDPANLEKNTKEKAPPSSPYKVIIGPM